MWNLRACPHIGTHKLHTPPPHAKQTRHRLRVSEKTSNSVGGCRLMVQRWLIHSLASKLNSSVQCKFLSSLGSYHPCQGQWTQSSHESDSIHGVSACGEMLRELVIHKWNISPNNVSVLHALIIFNHIVTSFFRPSIQQLLPTPL